MSQETIMQFRCLLFGLCTAPFVLSKLTKPIDQFLRQLGIHLIIYFRSFVGGSIHRPVATAPLHSHMVVHKPGVSDQHSKVHDKPISLPGIPRLYGGHTLNDHSLPTPKLQGIQKAATQLLHQKPMTVKD